MGHGRGTSGVNAADTEGNQPMCSISHAQRVSRRSSARSYRETRVRPSHAHLRL